MIRIYMAICKYSMQYAGVHARASSVLKLVARMAICLALSSDFPAPISVTRYWPDQSVSSRVLALCRCPPRNHLSKLQQSKSNSGLATEARDSYLIRLFGKDPKSLAED